MIWLSYIASDAFPEISAPIGRQNIRVWGVGDVNRKSVVGTVAGFPARSRSGAGSSPGNDLLGGPWVGLAVVIALSNTLVEFYSPRGTDDFTMATTNALICLAFGTWLH